MPHILRTFRIILIIQLDKTRSNIMFKSSTVNFLLLHITIFMLLSSQGTSFMFCFTKNSKPSQNSDSSIIHNEKFTSTSESQLRSYHPHYINSISYPQPMTPHIYYGEVIGPKAVFLYKDINLWNPESIERLTINGVQFTDASAKYYLLRREEVYRYMMAVQMESSYQIQQTYKINLFQRQDRYLIVCQYQDKFNAFLIYFTKNGKIAKMNERDLKGVRINIRNQSIGGAKENWRFSQNIMWRGRSTVETNSTNFVGVVFQIEHYDRNLNNLIKINLHELANPKKFSLQDFAAYQNKIDLASILPTKIAKSKKYQNCSAAAFQKIFDGLSYQYGTLRITDGAKMIQNQPKGLLSFCPSRKRFPWGFLWDDGFHCEVGVRKDEKLVIKIIKSWLDTMLQNGWIPREQNRGDERQFLCNCLRFMQKDIRDGNPPTLILALEYLKRNNKLNKQNFPLQYWTKLKKWYHWFLATQKDGDIFIFKWHDSINQMGASFTSGMDDFPRPTYSKGHVDLQSWMYFFTKFMAQTSHIYEDGNIEYISYLQLITANFQFFIETHTKLYKDISNSTEPSPHFGYPSILPIAFGVPAYGSPEYNATISAVKKLLDSGFGLTSISKQSKHYLQNQNAYWKGPVWMNINYLFLRGLKLYYPQQAQLYNKLRNNLISTVCGNWQLSGYFYENYIEGKGSFSFPFNGWTSLIAIIAQQNY